MGLLLLWLVGLLVSRQWRTVETGLEQTEALLKWIEELGGGVDGISLQSIPGMGMGVVTTRDLEVYTEPYCVYEAK